MEALEQDAVAGEATVSAAGKARVLGSNQVESEAALTSILIQLYRGADPLTVAHEFGEAWLKDAVARGEFTWEQLAGWVNAAREQMGERGKDLSQLSEKELEIYAREGWVDLYELYLLDQDHRLSLPQALREFFRGLTKILASAVKRAKALRDTLASEAVPAELRQSFEDALEMRGSSLEREGTSTSDPSFAATRLHIMKEMVPLSSRSSMISHTL